MITKRLMVLSLVVPMVLLCWQPGCKKTQNRWQQRENSLRQSLSYLSDIAEVAWFDVEKNDIYIGFESLPADWQDIVRAAAANGNRSINFGVHAWAVDAEQRGWRPGAGTYYGLVTARHGKIEKASFFR